MSTARKSQPAVAHVAGLRPLRAVTVLLLLAGLALNFASGCRPSPAPAAPAPPPEVEFILPLRQTVVDFEEFSGRTAASETVELRSRVSGYLLKVNFEDGAWVREGETLFEIDARSFRAEVERATAAIEQLKARIDRLRRQENRAQQLLATNAVSQDSYELLRSDLDESIAGLDAALATRELAALNLAFTKVQAPISGRISRRMVDAGNLIRADESILATIVTSDPLHVFFDMNERTVLRTRRLQAEGNPEVSGGSAASGGLGTVVRIALADESTYVREAVVDFIDNHVDPQTGTLRFRATLRNQGDLLAPGLFVRVWFPIGGPHEALTVPEEALASDQGQRCVYVVDDNDQIVYRRIRAGMLVDGRRVVESGLDDGERVVVTGLQRIRPGKKVVAKESVSDR
jgi:RND family efflux transporter MFP subunit